MAQYSRVAHYPVANICCSGAIYSLAAVALASDKRQTDRLTAAGCNETQKGRLTRPRTIAQFDRSVIDGNDDWMKLIAHRLYGLLAELTSKFLFLATGSNTSQPVTVAKATPI